MKKTLLRKIATRLAGSAAAVLMTIGVLGAPSALAAIASGKHDLSPSGAAGGAGYFTATAGNTEICVFCHTPHGADVTAGRPPLWNRNNSVATFPTYASLGSASLDGGTAAVGSISIACLSCHDGTQAMNTMINAPGSGLGGGVYAGTWTAGTRVNAAGKMISFANLNDGTNGLKNDHPVGIQYGGGMSSGVTTVYPSANIATASFKDPDFRGITYGALNGQPAWYVETSGSANGRQKTDLILYTRGAQTLTMTDGTTSAMTAGNQAFVECGSCHDPHSSNTTFLRLPNLGSAVCLACHIK